MKMKELERRTGVSRQMVQFYLAHGLLPEPARPKPNVADYGEEHIRAIATIRKLQTDGRLKINEIKQALNGSGTPAANGGGAAPHLDALFALRTGIDTELMPLQSLVGDDLQAKKDAKVLARVGAIQIHDQNGAPHLTRMDAQIVRLWGELRASGYSEKRGWSPQIVSMYVEAARKLAFAEIELFERHFDPELPVEERAAMAEAGSKLMLGVFTVLRMKSEVEAFALAEASNEGAASTGDPRRALSAARV